MSSPGTPNVRLLFLPLDTLGGLYPVLPHLTVVLRPPLGSLVRVTRLVDRVLQIVELILVEAKRIHERCCLRVVLRQVLVDYGGYTRRVVERTPSVLGILQVSH